MHGWPGSVFEFLDIIPMLTNPKRFGIESDIAFTVIAPSLPGFGLSFKAISKTVWSRRNRRLLKRFNG